MNNDTPKTPAELGLSLAIPEGIDPTNIAQRKRVLLDAGACNRETLNGQMAAEKIALYAELEQVKRDADIRAKEVVRLRKEAAKDEWLSEIEAASQAPTSAAA